MGLAHFGKQFVLENVDIAFDPVTGRDKVFLFRKNGLLRRLVLRLSKDLRAVRDRRAKQIDQARVRIRFLHFIFEILPGTNKLDHPRLHELQTVLVAVQELFLLGETAPDHLLGGFKLPVKKGQGRFRFRGPRTDQRRQAAKSCRIRKIIQKDLLFVILSLKPRNLPFGDTILQFRQEKGDRMGDLHPGHVFRHRHGALDPGDLHVDVSF
ncbi:MAG: hypothetical protein BWY49_00468 [Candidatus Omnitrophica bacterium ADurb.Bin314]|nr:MAG: hypothetical protein BWY49_00468 [Candidatus Omnitrophica bacterium ADurb.Bin314]